MKKSNMLTTVDPIDHSVYLRALPTANDICPLRGLDGPVVRAAKKALDTEMLLLFLSGSRRKTRKPSGMPSRRPFPSGSRHRQKIWRTCIFLKPLVRVHRAGEGVAYTALETGGT